MKAGPKELAARQSSLQALIDEGTSTEISDKLASAIELLADRVPGGGGTAASRAAYLTAFQVLEHFYAWDSAVQAAEPEADRFLRSGKRHAELGLERLAGAECAVGDWLQEASDLTSAQRLGDLREALARVPVPLSLIPSDDIRSGPRVPTEPDAPEPRVVVLARLQGVPLSEQMLIRPGLAYELEIEARVLDWPDWAEALSVRFLSQWNGAAIEIPDVSVERPGEGTNGVWRGTGAGGFVVTALPAERGKPIQLTFEAELRSTDRSQTVEVIGYRQLELFGFDPSIDQITGSEIVDKRVVEVLMEIESSAAPDQEKDAFRELFPALANEAQKLVANSTFRSGEHVLEAEFQEKLLDGAQSRLGAANVRTGGDVAGGTMDIVYREALTAELKIERSVTVTPDRVGRYLGQPAQYAAGAGRQLSILCILDVTESDAPVGVLANGIHLFRPAVAGLDDPDYPALVGVIVVRGGLPLPSSWSNRRVDATEVV